MNTYINGRFLTQKISGVQRFGRELVKALDKRLGQYGRNIKDQWTLLAPAGTICDLNLDTIEFQAAGTNSGHIWEQWDLNRLSHDGMLINLCNSGPVLHPKSFTIIHDAMIYRTPSNYSRNYRWSHSLLDRLVSIRSRIGTVSDFSRSELSEILGLKSVFVVPNGCDHLKGIQPDVQILERFGVQESRYFLFVGAPTANKNLALVVSALKQFDNNKPKCVVVGSSLSSIFDSGLTAASDQLIFTGRISDEAVVALYAGATALIFPSLYEGFGIPPLEAMLHGCPVVASSIPPLMEVCGESAIYIDPQNPTELATTMRRLTNDAELRSSLIASGRMTASEYTWDRSAQALLHAMDSSF